MAGCDLKEGRCDDRNVSDDELWSALAYVFSTKSKNDSSYKFGFLKSILDNVDNVDSNLVLTFDQLFTTFGEIYWNLVLKHGLRQKARTANGRESCIEQILHEAVSGFGTDKFVPYEGLSAVMKRNVSHQVKVKCKKYVVGALYEDTLHLFYSFNRKEEWIQIKPAMFTFVCNHMDEIEELNYLEWARFLEHANEASLSMTYRASSQDGFAKYRQILYEEFESGNYRREICNEINTFELLNDADEMLRKASTVEVANEHLKQSISMVRENNEALDEEAFALLDDPEALIKLLKKRRENYSMDDTVDRALDQRRWAREKVVVL